jgi:hypothetical protein
MISPARAPPSPQAVLATRGGSRSVPSRLKFDEEWLRALHAVTGVLRSDKSRRHDDPDATAATITAALDYLLACEKVLRKRKGNHGWSKLPPWAPPSLPALFAVVAAASSFPSWWDTSSHSPTTTVVPFSLSPAAQTFGPPARLFASFNRFSGLLDDEEDDDDSEQEKDSCETPHNNQNDDDDDDDDEAGDTVLVQGMIVRRILIRILVNLAELQSQQACNPNRVMGERAQDCGQALQQIQEAITMADEEICRSMRHHDNTTTTTSGSSVMDLREDADIVVVAIQNLSHQRNVLLRKGSSEAKRLAGRLLPQWKSRDAIKAKMGDRWANNPEPKQNFAQVRKDDEDRLHYLETVVETLEGLDTETLQEKGQNLQDRLGPDISQDDGPQRYNGTRPTNNYYRVAWEKYPDPADYGWTFTGSWSNSVEYFIKDNVTLDFYFTTGSLQTTLEHTSQGKMQLFISGKTVTPELFMQVLLDPVACTAQRYHTRDRGNGGSGRGGGRGGGRGRRVGN